MIKKYEEIIPIIRQVARNYGYALTFHGSGDRDLDLVAVPWIYECRSNEDLVEAVRVVVNGVVQKHDPMYFPHHRRNWTIKLTGKYCELYIDFNVIELSFVTM